MFMNYLSKSWRQDVRQLAKVGRSVLLLAIPLAILLVLNSSGSSAPPARTFKQARRPPAQSPVGMGQGAGGGPAATGDLRAASNGSDAQPGSSGGLQGMTVVALSDTHGLYHQPTLGVPQGERVSGVGAAQVLARTRTATARGPCPHPHK